MSVGSIQHQKQRCKPCVFYHNRDRKCINGIYCLFCHYEHPIRKRLRLSKAKRGKIKEWEERYRDAQEAAGGTDNGTAHIPDLPDDPVVAYQLVQQCRKWCPTHVMDELESRLRRSHLGGARGLLGPDVVLSSDHAGGGAQGGAPHGYFMLPPGHRDHAVPYSGVDAYNALVSPQLPHPSSCYLPLPPAGQHRHPSPVPQQFHYANGPHYLGGFSSGGDGSPSGGSGPPLSPISDGFSRRGPHMAVTTCMNILHSPNAATFPSASPIPSPSASASRGSAAAQAGGAFLSPFFQQLPAPADG
eukprot:GHVU01170318.1.p3 GENE.GHVU01170318.1~~GHVU01170318.1.p3  ORF type:complete len:301 (-),score=41.98 GHVU01170318.1:400-1302(-)